jgi:uncharacterized protein YegJ (DUF2314 family)
MTSNLVTDASVNRMTNLVIGSVVVVLAAAVFVWFRKRRAEQEDEHEMLSFVALLKEPQYLEAVILASAAKRAWNADLGNGTEDSEGEDGFIAGESPTCIIRYGERMVLVNSFPQPYVESPEEAAESIPDLRLREPFAQHRAWISCDALGVDSFDDIEDVRAWYRLLGPLLSELVDDNCLAIFLPQTNQLYANMEATLEMLKSDDPLSALNDDAPVPVIQIRDDDPRMIAAVQKARDQWPVFIAAFEQDAGENFGVKAPITVGDNTEFIWLSVGAVENGVIYGKLANEPIDLGRLKLGSQVKTTVQELNDWAFVDSSGKPQGLFTVKVLKEAENQRQRELEEE